jgi:hypothetical protein
VVDLDRVAAFHPRRPHSGAQARQGAVAARTSHLRRYPRRVTSSYDADAQMCGQSTAAKYAANGARDPLAHRGAGEVCGRR